MHYMCIYASGSSSSEGVPFISLVGPIDLREEQNRHCRDFGSRKEEHSCCSHNSGVQGFKHGSAELVSQFCDNNIHCATLNVTQRCAS